ncbi:MAG: hypothetical protein U1D67_06660 [Dehalococcoidia bacterium]|nr:hypothetical protein [Dehalococcoidia bacterium]MDZ4246780.1 hypothetical protein [Dehalococcoidia bacterium]
MSKTSLGFIFSSMVYLVLGIALGVVFFIFPQTRALQSVHGHLNLVGFVIFLIFGVAYHILPRFRGRPLYSERLAWWGFIVGNVGLVGLLLFNTLAALHVGGSLAVFQAAFGGILALSIYMFIFNMFKTLF